MKNYDSNNSYKQIMPEQDRLIYDEQNRRQTNQPFSTPTQSSGTYHPSAVNTPMQSNGLYRPNTANTAQNNPISYLSTTPHSQLNYSNVSRGNLDTNKPVSYNTYTGKNTGSNYATIAKADGSRKSYNSTAMGYCNTGFNTFSDFYNFSITNPQRTDSIISALKEQDPDSLKQIVNDYVYCQGGVKKGNNNIYQVLYNVPTEGYAKNTRNNDLNDGDPNKYFYSERDMYDNDRFTFFKALNWLLQSGGSGNFALQTRITDKVDEAAKGQKEMINQFIDATKYLQDIGVISADTRPKLYIGSTEYSGISAKDIYEKIMADPKISENIDIIGGIYYGKEDYDKNNMEEAKKHMNEVSSFIHGKGKNLIWIPYLRDVKSYEARDNSLWEIENLALGSDDYGRPIFDTVMVQPGEFYYSDHEGCIEDIVKWVRNTNNKNDPNSPKRFGIEMEMDMGVVTGRRINSDRIDYLKKRESLNKYLDAYDELADLGIPIGVYSGGPNEQGYDNIWSNNSTHNIGNHIPYWDGIDESAYAYGVPYSEFPNSYIGGNPMYDLNNYYYNGEWSPALTDSLWLTSR